MNLEHTWSIQSTSISSPVVQTPLNTPSVHWWRSCTVSRDQPRRTRFWLRFTVVLKLHPTWSLLRSLASVVVGGPAVGCREKQVTSWLLLPLNSSAALRSAAKSSEQQFSWGDKSSRVSVPSRGLCWLSRQAQNICFLNQDLVFYLYRMKCCYVEFCHPRIHRETTLLTSKWQIVFFLSCILLTHEVQVCVRHHLVTDWMQSKLIENSTQTSFYSHWAFFGLNLA